MTNARLFHTVAFSAVAREVAGGPAGGVIFWLPMHAQCTGRARWGAGMEILDFEMEIGALAGQGYPVTARAPAGEASASMRLPLSRDQLERPAAGVHDQ